MNRRPKVKYVGDTQNVRVTKYDKFQRSVVGSTVIAVPHNGAGDGVKFDPQPFLDRFPGFLPACMAQGSTESEVMRVLARDEDFGASALAHCYGRFVNEATAGRISVYIVEVVNSIVNGSNIHRPASGSVPDIFSKTEFPKLLSEIVGWQEGVRNDYMGAIDDLMSTLRVRLLHDLHTFEPITRPNVSGTDAPLRLRPNNHVTYDRSWDARNGIRRGDQVLTAMGLKDHERLLPHNGAIMKLTSYLREVLGIYLRINNPYNVVPNSGTHRLMVRYPKRVLASETVKTRLMKTREGIWVPLEGELDEEKVAIMGEQVFGPMAVKCRIERESRSARPARSEREVEVTTNVNAKSG